MRSSRIVANVAVLAATALGAGACASVLGLDDVGYGAPTSGAATVLADLDAEARDAGAGTASDGSSFDGAAPGAPTGYDAGDAGATTAERAFVFVTSVHLDGPGVGGTTAADLRCTGLAHAHGLKGDYMAWISSSTSDAISRLPADGGPWYLTDPSHDTIAFASLADLVTNGPAAPIAFMEDGGRTPTPTLLVWTGTDPDGRAAAGATCDDWVGTGGQGMSGSSVDGGFWTGSTTSNCDQEHPLYCFRK
jgi:hypothetical protein